ncbi:SDR family NAD(P)-dependent oxidoreductase [Aeromicrobium terrae]|uniref:SDR family oxidoreductase n=1 Tax=Aeromicrobium terrae TaxID=2498846 RepID=A0A5C8NK47_9ACTN|nr:SDR family oxidoreductase [Aeromicrobium terrae]TXL61530.1 SDR family oxidoreductase [Aeromicrobium terrae]
MARNLELRGARTLVTGATGGLGQAIARRLAAEGAELVLTGRRIDVLEPLAAELGARTVAADLADLAEVDRLMAEAGPLDLLVANAALPTSGHLLEYTPEQVERALTVNLHAPIALTRTAAEGMVERGRGHVVLIGSVSGKVASVSSSLYNATKFGLRGFALGFRQDVAQHGVGVSVVEPGFVRDAGMFVEGGGKLPPGMRTVTPEAVAAGVVKAVRRNKPEVVVAPAELRAGAAVGSVLAGVSEKLQKAGGGAKVAATLAEGQKDKR